MTGSPCTALSPARHAGRRPRGTWLVVLVVLLVALLGSALVVGRPAAPPPGAGLAGEASVTAGSSEVGYPARNLVTSGSAQSPGEPWRATEGTGAWVELTWGRPVTVTAVTLVQPSSDQPAVVAGHLTFGDGSAVQVSTSAPVTVLPVVARTVDRLRFTVSGLAPGVDVAALGEILVSSDPQAAAAHGGGIGGDVTPLARTSTGGPDAGAPPGDQGTGTTLDPAGGWTQLSWPTPREITGVVLTGTPDAAAGVASGTLTFSDGSTMPVGAVEEDPRLPTHLAFMPRVTSSVRFTVDRSTAPGPVSLAGVRAFETGATPPRTAGPAGPPGPTVAPRSAARCDAPAGPPDRLTVSCPQNGALVGGPIDLEVAGLSGRTQVTATVWPADSQAPPPGTVEAAPDAGGAASMRVDPTALPPGPFTVHVHASGGERAAEDVYLQLVRSGPAPAGHVPSGPASVGRTLVYDEEFDDPLSVSRAGEGTTYSAAKPVHDGVQDFGDAVFTDPATGPQTLSVADGLLRMGVEPLPAGARDPQGWGRTYAGSMLTSARPGGSGFAAQNAYFEVRMLAPAAPGTWPAFWMLPADNLVAPTPAVAEIDAVELYGHEPRGACHSTHEYRDGEDGGEGQCRDDLYPSVRDAMAWHTYGVSITPSAVEFSVDGEVVATAPQVAGGQAPMFFLVDLALGGGWPVDLGGSDGRTDLYVDYIRVYV